jgi:hypothetical protein
MRHSMRNWHTWTSVALGVPLLLVGLTTFFIAHDKALGTRDVTVPWLAERAAAGGAVPDIRASARVGDAWWLGTPLGVFRLDGARAMPVDGSPRDEIRAIAAGADAVLLAGRKGLWLHASGGSQQVLAADCWHVARHPDGFSAACKEIGLLRSVDARAWQPHAVEWPAGSLPPDAAGRPLSKLILDIHTGKLFFGKQYEWIWIDLLGLTCVGLGLTGLVMWMRGRRRRAGPQG